MNENYWLLKFMSFATILMFNMFIPLRVWIFYGLFAKFISVIVLALQIVILNDILLIFCEKYMVPFRQSGKCGLVTTMILGIIIPVISNLSLFAYNFVVYTPLCTPYLLINTFILLMITMLIIINLMRLRNIAGPVISTLWFTLFIGILNYSLISSTPHSKCQVLQSDGSYSTSVKYSDTVIDSLLSFVLLILMFVFLCVMTKKDAKKYNYYVESWFYFFVLREVGNTYMRYAPKFKIDRRKRLQEQEVELQELAGKDGPKQPSVSRVMREIVEKNVVRKLAVGTYKIPNDFDPNRVKFRSKQAFFFHLLMSLFGAYTAVIFTSWIHITVADISTGTEVYDNTSIWARFVAVTFGILFSMVKVFRAQHYYSRLREDEDYYRSDASQDESSSEN